MVEKTKGIVLNRIKYTDSGIIAQLYTRKYGRQSFLVRNLKNKKAGRHNVFFQPLFILDLVAYFRDSRSMQTIKEFSVSYTPADIYSNVNKSSVAIFLGEVLTSVLREESPGEDLFDFIEDSVIYFDGCRENYANFHIAFLAGLSSYLGFEPGKRKSVEDSFFDMLNGIFVPVPPLHGNYASREISDILALFFASSYEKIDKIFLNGSSRNEVLETLVNYYSLHLPGLKKIKSLEVLKEVFR
ncbi:MAG: DNA repair protein RecO [Bacteroidales bacterium]